jgi:2-keto-4-pentenoate hydratase/2-oxohepta-3-ene-1,7-dioic acid hydratase in catechol pathway
VPRPPKVLGIGLNYAAHVAETGAARPEHQVWFNKQRTCVVGPEEAIVIPAVSGQVDYEGELAMVVGRRCHGLSAADAPGAVAGFTVLNDVSVRDWQYRVPTWTLGKSFDTHGPTGPWIVTADEIVDPQDLRLRTWVNDELRQDTSTGDMIFSCWEQLECLSTVFTLEPGDIISTGTPAGVGMSFDPPRWLVAGDVVRIDIEGVGTLTNPVVGPPGP